MARVPTRGELIYDRIRADILTGRVRPGSRLRFGDLSSKYGASMGVLREALSSLKAEGLVTTEPQLGFRVVTLSLKDFQDLTEARCEIESIALRSAVKHGTMAWEQAIVAARHRLERAPLRDGIDPDKLTDEWAVAHTALHRSLISGCPNKKLLAILEGIWAELELYIRWSAPVMPATRDIKDEHAQLVEAALARDADMLSEALIEHVTTTHQVLLNGLGHFLDRTVPPIPDKPGLDGAGDNGAGQDWADENGADENGAGKNWVW